MANPLDRLKDLHRKVFVKGQETVAKELAAVEFQEQQDHTQRVLKAAAETINMATQLADGNPHLQRLAEDVALAVREGAAEAVAGRQRVAERGEAPEAAPFSASSANSVPSLPESPTPKALPHDSQPPAKRKRGRPRKES